MSTPHTANALVIGGGPAGLMAADVMAGRGLAVTVIERMPTLGRKFLLAGRGGLNLTHGEPIEFFPARYGAAGPRIAQLLDVFPPQALREFADALGQQTFEGSSGRIFPRAMKASPMLRAWIGRLAGLGVRFEMRTRFLGLTPEGAARVEPERGERAIAADAIVLALGGASWPRLGADGAWVAPLREAGLDVAALAPSNCGLMIAWSAPILARHVGLPLKRIALRVGDEKARGDLVITRQGLEGGPAYALSPLLRERAAQGEASVDLDLRPDLSEAEIAERWSRRRKGDSTANALRKAAGLSSEAIAVLREAGAPPAEPAALARAVKAVRLRVTGVAGLERAISTAGGVRFAALDEGLMATGRPGLFLAGEMLDWEAPTGGYLLQACFASGYVAGRAAADHALRRPEDAP